MRNNSGRRAVLFYFFVGLHILFITSGCSKPKPPAVPTYKTTGTVVYKNGDPVASAIVQFISDQDPSLNISSQTGEDGSFELVTLHGNDNLNGALAGPCKAWITLPIVGPEPPTTIEMKTAYEITQGDNHFDIKLGVNAKK